MSAVPQLPPEPRSSAATSLDRRIQMLRTAMGPLIAAALLFANVCSAAAAPSTVAALGDISCQPGSIDRTSRHDESALLPAGAERPRHWCPV